jgi:hypothetical protein
MIEKVYIVVKYEPTSKLGLQPVFKKVFFNFKLAQGYVDACEEPSLYEILAFVESKRGDGSAQEI